MGHPSPSASEWRRAVRDAELGRAASVLAEWISRRPVVGRPGVYRGGQLVAAVELHYSRATVTRAQRDLVVAGLLVLVERGVKDRPVSTFELRDNASP